MIGYLMVSLKARTQNADVKVKLQATFFAFKARAAVALCIRVFAKSSERIVWCE